MVEVFSSARLRAIALIGATVLLVSACFPDIGSGPSIDPNEPVKVALLVPGGSGEAGDEVLARSLENAARLAIADLGGEAQIDLAVYQTRGNPDMAAFQAVTAINEGARIILGPLFAQSAVAVGAAIAEREVNVLSFSSTASAAGGNVFVLGSTFEGKAERLLQFAAAQGRNRVMVVHSDTIPGRDGAAAVERAVNLTGGLLVARSGYPLSQEEIIAAVPIIADTIETTAATALVLTADTNGELPLIQQLLPEAGVDSEATKFIGLTRWDIPASALALPGLQGGWFALPDPDLSAAFAERFAATYGSSPHPVAGLAYDGIAAIGALVSAGQRDALTASALTQTNGFVGVGGVFRLLPDGTNERALAIAQIQANQLVVIDPAPRSFGFGGF